MKKAFIIKVWVIALAALALPVSAKAKSFNWQVVSSTVRSGQEFEAVLFLSVQPQPINAVEAEIFFPGDLLTLQEIRDGGSILNLWVEKPVLVSSASSEQRGVVRFSGVIPGGFEGVINPFTKQEEPGKLLSLVFKAKRAGEGTISLLHANLLLNDGQGTAAAVTFDPLLITVSDSAPQLPAPQLNDQIPPEPFQIQLGRDPSISKNRWFVSFAAQDKDSGIDFYEVAEKRFEPESSLADLKWVKTESPYVLKDQNLASYVYVRAVDKAGNVKVATFVPQAAKVSYQNQKKWGIISLAVFILVFSFLFWKNRKQNARKNLIP